jgi:ABC-type sugar transport system ATPase subunit
MKKSPPRNFLTEAIAERDKEQTALTLATREHEKATAALVTATAQVRNLKDERDRARFDVANSKGVIVGLTGQRDKAKTDLAAAFTDIANLEKVCGIHGVAPANAIRLGDPVQKVSAADYALKMKAAKTPAARAQLCTEYERAVLEKRVSE